MIDLLLIFRPLKDKKALKIFIASFLIISLIYFTFSILTVMLSIGFEKIPLSQLFMFALIKAPTLYTFADWVVLVLFPIFGGLLFANYSYWKCKSSNVAHLGIIGGFVAATCPACILPLLGLATLTTSVFNISWIVKIGVLLLLIASTYAVAYKQQKCMLNKNS